MATDVMSDRVEPILNPQYDLHNLLISPNQRRWATTAEDAVVLDAAQVLTSRFAECFPRYEVLDRYYRGVPPMPMMPVRVTEKVQELMQISRSKQPRRRDRGRGR